MADSDLQSERMKDILRKEVKHLRAQAARAHREGERRKQERLRFDCTLVAKAFTEAALLLAWYAGDGGGDEATTRPSGSLHDSPASGSVEVAPRISKIRRR